MSDRLRQAMKSHLSSMDQDRLSKIDSLSNIDSVITLSYEQSLPKDSLKLDTLNQAATNVLIDEFVDKRVPYKGEEDYSGRTGVQWQDYSISDIFSGKNKNFKFDSESKIIYKDTDVDYDTGEPNILGRQWYLWDDKVGHRDWYGLEEMYIDFPDAYKSVTESLKKEGKTIEVTPLNDIYSPEEGKDYIISEKTKPSPLAASAAPSFYEKGREAIDKWLSAYVDKPVEQEFPEQDPDNWVGKKEKIWQGYPPERDAVQKEIRERRQQFQKDIENIDNMEGWGDNIFLERNIDRDVSDSLKAIGDYVQSDSEVSTYVETDSVYAGLPENYWDPEYDNGRLVEYLNDPLSED